MLNLPVTRGLPLDPIDLQNVPAHVKQVLAAEPGAHIVGVNDPDLLSYVVHYITHQAAIGGRMQGVPYPALPAAVLLGGSQRFANEMAHLGSRLQLKRTETTKTLHHIAAVSVEVEHQETLELMRPFIARGRHHVVLRLDRPLAGAREAIARIDHAAASAGAFVFLVAPFSDSSELLPLRHAAAEVFSVERAEEDPHCSLAWTMGSSSLDYRRFFGGGHDLIQIKGENNGLHIVEEALISASLIDRVIWKCHRSGLTLAETGSVVRRDKATVSRIVRSLPKRQTHKLPNEWWSIYLESFSFSEPILAKLAESDPET